jgi:hypothetical protein
MFEKELSTFELNVNGVKEYIDPNQDLFINESDLLSEFSEQPAKYAFYGGLYTDAFISLEEFRNTLKKYEADAELTMRQRILERFGATERITEAKMEAEFARDEQWQQLQAAIFTWERQVRRLEMVKDAFKQRAQMLWNIGATRRQEMVRLSPDAPTEE